MQKTKFVKIGTIQYAANSPAQTLEYKKGGVLRRVFFVLSGVNTVTDVTAPGTVVTRNPGTLVPSLSITVDDENVIKRGRWNDWKDRNTLFLKAPAETAEGAGANATTIASRIVIPFNVPGGVRPVDTGLNCNGRKVSFDFQWADENALLNAPTAQGFTTNPTIDVYGEISMYDPGPIAVYKELGFDSTSLGTSANTELEIKLNTGPGIDYHHIILLAEDNVSLSGRALVAKINTIELLASGVNNEQASYYGPVDADDAQYEFDMTFNKGGVTTGIYPIVAQPRFDGRYTFNYQTHDLTELKLKINHGAFATQGFIRVLTGIVSLRG